MKKSKVMKHENTHHEILLFTGTSFASREFCSKENENDNGRKLSQSEELEKACWDGMLNDLFPEILKCFKARCESFIWQIMSGKNYLVIHWGPTPMIAENETTIDPYFFMLSSCEN